MKTMTKMKIMTKHSIILRDKLDSIFIGYVNKHIITNVTHHGEVCVDKINFLKHIREIESVVRAIDNYELGFRDYDEKYYIKNKHFQIAIKFVNDKKFALFFEGKEASVVIILNHKQLYKFRDFLKIILKEDGIKMKSVLKLNCIEEQEDSLELIDCDDGKNVAIQLNNEEEIGMVYMDKEEAMQLAMKIIAHFK